MVKNATIKVLLLSSFFLATGVVGCRNQPAQVQAQVPLNRQVEEVANRLQGVMTTTEQARSNPDAPDVRMTTCKVEVEDAAASQLTDSPVTFLYQEQALSSKLDQPYRQRFLRISVSGDRQSVESAGFEPANPQAFVGLCKKPETQRMVKLSDLGTYRCSVFLKPIGENYQGETPESGCPSNYRGAARIANTVILQPGGMETWDRGFDAAGNQVWGAQDKPYQFRKLISVPERD